MTTVVTGTITDPAGDLVSGSWSIQAVGPFSAATRWRVGGAQTVGPYSWEPRDWLVPTNSTALDIGSEM